MFTRVFFLVLLMGMSLSSLNVFAFNPDADLRIPYGKDSDGGDNPASPGCLMDCTYATDICTDECLDGDRIKEYIASGTCTTNPVFSYKIYSCNAWCGETSNSTGICQGGYGSCGGGAYCLCY